MLSLCGVVPPPPPPPLPPPPHPAIPATTQARSNAPEQAYPRRLVQGANRGDRRLSINAASNSPATSQIGPTGRLGIRFEGATGGVRSASVVIKVAVHVPGVEAVPAVGMQVAGVPSAAVPFMNCTVPVGPAAALVVPVTTAVKVTLPPDAIEVALGVTTVVVTCVPPVTVTATAADVDVA